MTDARIEALSELIDERLRSIRLTLGMPERESREQSVDEIRAESAELRFRNDAVEAGRRRRTTFRLVKGTG